MTCYTSQIFFTLAPHHVSVAINFSSIVLKSCNGHFCDTEECLKAWAPKQFIYRPLDMLGSYFWNRHSSITVVAIATHAQLTQLRFSALLCHLSIKDLRWWNKNHLLQQRRTANRGLFITQEKELWGQTWPSEDLAGMAPAIMLVPCWHTAMP